ncbi:virion structural protein [Vibrio phage K469]
MKVEGYPDLVRDDRTGIIVNTDTAAYLAHKKRQTFMRTQSQKTEDLEKELERMKCLINQMVGGGV